MRFTVDTNILVYAHDRSAGLRHRQAVALMERALAADCVLTLQALGELFHVLVRKQKMSLHEARGVITDLSDATAVVSADRQGLLDAMDIVRDHKWSFWDAMILATARRAGCRLLLTEDGQDGRGLHGITLADPFAEAPSPLIEQALSGA